MIMFKACPRCQGDMHQNRDMYGEYRECLMCGYMADLRKPSLFSMEPVPAPAPVRKTVSKRTSHERAFSFSERQRSGTGQKSPAAYQKLPKRSSFQGSASMW